MSRDYAKTPKPRHPHSLPGWVWMLGGLVIGLFVALLVYIDQNTTASHTTSVSESLNDLVGKFKQDTREVRKTTQDAPTPPATETETRSRPRFDFYTILPELEIVIPEHELLERSKATSPGDSAPPAAVKPAAEPGLRYILQAGSFRNPDQADQLRAQLALIGIEATVQTVTINDGDTWHRVRIGPLEDLTDLNRTRKRLHDNGINTMVIKEKS
jgi:cell division protein FtsN